MNNIDQISLRGHYLENILVGARRLVDHIFILTTFNSSRSSLMIGNSKTLTRCRSRHRATSAVAATMEALSITASTHNKRLRAHAARNYSHIASTRAHGAFARDKDILAIMVLDRDIVMMTVDHRCFSLKWRHPFSSAHCRD